MQVKKLIPNAIKNRIRVAVLAGNDVHCSICNGQFVTFLPFGVIKRPNAMCPQCFSLERHRLIWLYLRQQPLFQAGKRFRMLHVAPESALFQLFSANAQIDYTAGDKFEPGYRYPAKTINLDITQIAFPDNSFDLILCNHVLEHVPDDAKAMRELFRVLKPGGFAILQIPIDYQLAVTQEDLSVTDPKERERLYGQHDHVRQYGLDYANRLEAAGFKVEINKLNDSFGKAEKFKLGMAEREDLYICHK